MENFLEGLSKGWKIFVILLCAVGLGFIFALATSLVIGWFSFLFSFTLWTAFWFFILQLESVFYRKYFLPAGAVITGLIIFYVLAIKPATWYFKSSHSFTARHIARSFESAETSFCEFITGTGKSSEARRDLLDTASYYEDTELRDKVQTHLEKHEFEKAAELIKEWELRHKKVLGILENNPETQSPPTTNPSTQSQQAESNGKSAISPKIYGPGTYSFSLTAGEESEWIAFDPNRKTKATFYFTDDSDFVRIHDNGEVVAKNAFDHKNGQVFKFRANQPSKIRMVII